jgi:hypothetical protein
MTQGAYFSTGIGSAFGSIVSGSTTIVTSGTAIRITSTSTPVPGVWVGSDEANAGLIVVGDVNVSGVSGSQQGIMVEPAGNSIFIPVNNLNLLWVDTSVNGGIATWAYVQPVTD